MEAGKPACAVVVKDLTMCSLFSLEQDQKFSTMAMLAMRTVMDKLHLKTPCMIQT